MGNEARDPNLTSGGIRRGRKTATGWHGRIQQTGIACTVPLTLIDPPFLHVHVTLRGFCLFFGGVGFGSVVSGGKGHWGFVGPGAIDRPVLSSIFTDSGLRLRGSIPSE